MLYKNNPIVKKQKGCFFIWIDKKDNGKIKKEIADKLALDEYGKYRVVQDQKYISDFDELILKTKNIESSE